MSSQHKHNPIPFRPPSPEREWLLRYAADTGRPVNAILTEALSEYRSRHQLSSPHPDPESGR